MYIYQIKIKDKNIKPAQLANFLKKYVGYQHYGNLTYYLDLAKKLLNEEVYELDYDAQIPDNEFVDVVMIEKEEEENSMVNYRKERKLLEQLMIKGATGDAEAAILFCKAVEEGRYFMGAYA